ncbi:hypothetical protein SBA5_1100018 [Candidatus Sulfotelmatomonas gaucii]|uniref:Uncharacterized protein n=1 Tax=Candidatus Sulfuritelmatomonas gaucii TaxID=2043161 RepID=A0A2N9L3H9_9BACT|nr:hypothetical protein SBA5_1100018 [Candidatus Sulfotelmatomonas gaucii]
MRDWAYLCRPSAPLHQHSKGVTMWVSSRTSEAPAIAPGFSFVGLILLGFLARTTTSACLALGC